MVTAAGCARLIVRSVPKDYAMCQAVFSTAVEFLRLDPTKQLVYKGEGKSQVMERLRLEVSRPTRRKWPLELRAAILHAQGDQCKTCEEHIAIGASGELVGAHVDHVTPLSRGGSDDAGNLQILCVTCHGQKSEEGRLSGMYRKSLYSELSRDMLEVFMLAPKPKQLVFGDNAKDCIEIDAIRCRSSALVYNTHPLPIASVVDVVRYGSDMDPDPQWTSC